MTDQWFGVADKWALKANSGAMTNALALLACFTSGFVRYCNRLLQLPRQGKGHVLLNAVELADLTGFPAVQFVHDVLHEYFRR